MSKQFASQNGLLRSVSSVFGRQIYTAVLGLVAAIINARLLGPHGAGLYSTAMLLPNIMFAFLNMGMGYSATYLINSNALNLRGAHAIILHIWKITSLTILPVGVALYFAGQIVFPNIPKSLLFLSLPLFPLLLLNSGYLGMFQALEDFKNFNLISAAIPTASLVGTLIFVLLLKLGPLGAILAVLTSYGFGLALGWTLLRRRLHSEPRSPSRPTARKFLGYGIKSGAADAIQFINYRADLYFVNLFLGAGGAGLYSLAISLCERLWMISDAFTAVLFPRFTKLGEDAKTIFLLSAGLVGAIAALGAAAMAVVLHIFIVPIFGAAFAGSLHAVDWLLPGIAAITLAKVFSSFLASKGKIGLNVGASLAGMLINITSNLYLTPRYGIGGAALATTLGYVAISAFTGLFCVYELSSSRRRTV